VIDGSPTTLARRQWSARAAAAIAVGIALLLPSPPATAQQPRLVGVASVLDGDTIEIHGQRIRLFGIVSPEGAQPCYRPSGEPWQCGQQAADALGQEIGQATIRCVQRDRDRFGRIVAVCFRCTEDLGRWMVRQGWAVAFRRYAEDYVGDEAVARRSRRGLGSGNFEMPWGTGAPSSAAVKQPAACR
jgi:endonuclease YncB( thermonuclease family)